MENRQDLKSTKDAAAYLNLSPATLAQQRTYGTGATFVKMGGRVFYTVEDLDAYIASRRVTDTAQGRALQADKRRAHITSRRHTATA